ncbi:MAG: 2'-5' RNA ligase family protein [Chloroflexota bacterium]|nr:MAG: 2'-5' RNA ligase family protein [Chloroflexota bacterium]
MEGIVSLLDPPHNAEVVKIWEELEAGCGLVGIKITPIPHFSWQIAQAYPPDRLKPILQGIAQSTRPFMAQTSGLGVFSGDRPVVFIALVKTDELLQFHRLVWDFTVDQAITVNPFYAPHEWMPHITLAHATALGPMDGDSLNCAMERLAFRPFRWQIPVDNIALIGQSEGSVAEASLYYRFNG